MSRAAVLLLGHGSRAENANADMYRVADALRAGGDYLAVECAFLEINAPDIPTGLSNCLASDLAQIVVVPYFLHLGRHVQEDLPGIIGLWQAQHPNVSVVVGQHLGFSPKLVELVRERITACLP